MTMDGSRGATGSVDVGVSHLNMNINVIGGGHGLGSSGLTSNDVDKSNAGVDSSSSSPPVGEASDTRRGFRRSPMLRVSLGGSRRGSVLYAK